MDKDLLERLARVALLVLAAAVVATSYIVTEPPQNGRGLAAAAHAGTPLDAPPR